MFKVIYTVYKSMFCPCMKIFLQFSIYKYYLICIHNCIYIYIYLFVYIHIIVEGSLEVKLPTIWTDEKQRWSRRIEREEKSRREKIREEKESEERRCRCAKRWKSRETLCFSNDLWLRKIKK